MFTKHTLSYQYNISSLTSYISLSQGSHHSQSESLTTTIFKLAVATSKLTAVADLNIEESTIRAYWPQRGPISLEWVLPISTSQSTNFNPSLLIAARSNLAVMSTRDSDQPHHKTLCTCQHNNLSQNKALPCCRYTQLHLPRSWNFLPSPVKCSTLYAQLTGSLTIFLQQSPFNQQSCNPPNSALELCFNILIILNMLLDQKHIITCSNFSKKNLAHKFKNSTWNQPRLNK